MAEFLELTMCIAGVVVFSTAIAYGTVLCVMIAVIKKERKDKEKWMR